MPDNEGTGFECCFGFSWRRHCMLSKAHARSESRGSSPTEPPHSPSGKASTSRAEDPRFESRLRRDFFGGRVIPVTSKLALQWLPCPATGVIGSALGLVGPVSVYCDWVRWKVWSATSISVWQHVKLSEQIRPWDTLACCWDVKQPTNQSPTDAWDHGWPDRLKKQWACPRNARKLGGPPQCILLLFPSG